MPTDNSLSRFISKSAKAYRPDRHAEFRDWHSNLSRHPDASTQAFFVPLKAYNETMGRNEETHMDVAKRNREEAEGKLATKQAFKAGLLLRCAESGMTMDQLEQHVDSLLKKSADLASALGYLTGKATNLGGSLVSGAAQLGTAGLIGAPVLGGGLAGYLLGSRGSKPDIEGIKTDNMRQEYLRMAAEAKKRTEIKRMQDENPGSIVQIA